MKPESISDVTGGWLRLLVVPLLGATGDDGKEDRLQPDGRNSLPVSPLVGCAKRAAECAGDLSRCPFLECVFKHERTLKEKCPMGKKNVDDLPNGQYPRGEMKTKGYTAERPWRLTRNDGKVEAERYMKCEGSSFSGWIVRSTTDQLSYSDPIPNKASAIKHLLEWDA
jgi:hypothetical protein